VHDVKAVAEKLLGPTANLMDGSIVLQNFLDATAVAKPVKEAPHKYLRFWLMTQ
jgi:hypothetical protein